MLGETNVQAAAAVSQQPGNASHLDQPPPIIWEAMLTGDVLVHHLTAIPSSSLDTPRLHRLGGWNGPVTMLQVASFHGYLDVVGALLDAGARTDTRDAFGHSPLHFAVLGRDEDVVRLLLRHGANAGAVDWHGNAPLHLAKDARVAKALLEGGARVDARNYARETPLLCAVRSCNAECAGVLVKAGADVEAEDAGGISALDWAVKRKFASVGEFVSSGGFVERLSLKEIVVVKVE
ncbi:hypothetical protein HDU96_011078 [Phlyctochytrium bullatum]|nr:hypothetical protein HDU96_011078 [Phlyctochytrium bullatum]